MNLDLQNFIDTFSILDDEALFDIGVFHKSLPQNQKDWKELYEYLKIDRFNSGENYRKWVVSRQRQGYISTTTNPLVNTSIALQEKQREILKEKIMARDIASDVRRDIRDSARTEKFISLLKESIEKLDTLPKIRFTGRVRGNNEAVLLLSDLHIGAECDSFYNTYNVDVAKERLSILSSSVIEFCKNNKVKRLNVLGLGDFIQGLIHISGRVSQQVDVASQCSIAADFIAQFLNSLQAGVPEITYRSCSDNHARMIANKEESIEKENFSVLINEIIELRLKGTKIKFEKDNLDYGLGKFKLLNGKTCMFAHGHEDKVNRVFQNYVGASQEYIDYIFLAHYHSSAAKNFQNCRVFVNGSIMGTDDYALSRRYFTKPTQKMIIFNDNSTLMDIDISLAK